MEEATPLFGVDNQGHRTVGQTTKSACSIMWIQPYCLIMQPAKTRRTRVRELSLKYNLSQEAPGGDPK